MPVWGGSLSPASAATTDIGAVSEIRADTAPDPNTAAGGDGLYVVQVGEAAGTYAVPSGYGVITAWSHRTGTTPGALTFKVYRPTGTAGRYLTVAASARTVKEGTINEFPVRIPVRPADRIGISTTTVQVAYTTLNPVDQMGFFSFRTPDPAPGTAATLDGLPGPNYRADVAARVETDRDGDGFGDDTQDGCPTSPAAQGACPGVTLPPFAGCPALAANVIRGKPGSDRIAGTLRADRIFAAGGGDTATGLEGDDCIDLGAGKDRGTGGPGTTSCSAGRARIA